MTTRKQFERPMKYVVVAGGTASGIGKGITASSIGVLLKGCGMKVSSIKIDPYINLDAGTMSPYEHGEVFVLDDGGEADLDLGNYERFLSVRLGKDNNITTGKIYQSVIERERQGKYLGKTVQVVPHITDAIMEWIEKVAATVIDEDNTTGEATVVEADICVIELGGTVGDIESMPFIEALRQLKFKVGDENLCLVQVTLVPFVSAGGEQKTKPTQHAVKELRSAGLLPDIICCRCATPLEEATVKKLSLFCQVPQSNVISVHNVPDIYNVPLLLEEQNVAEIIAQKLKIFIPKGFPRISEWHALIQQIDSAVQEVRIAMVGKYIEQTDSYLSVVHALKHASIRANRKLKIEWVDSEDLTSENSRPAFEILKKANGILVPGGFGSRGIEGKVLAVKFARENKIPFFGICLGLQIAVMEFCRNVLGVEGATSEEFLEGVEVDPKPAAVIVFMPEVSKTHMGGTMRLGARETVLAESGTLARRLYTDHKSILERHRHRYEVNPDFVERIEAAGLKFTGRDTENKRMEILELSSETHPFFFAVQYHPEFLSRVLKPSPPFLGFILAASGQSLP